MPTVQDSAPRRTKPRRRNSGALAADLLAVPVVVAVIAGAGPAFARDVYEYRVEHPKYGEIGTYTNIIDTSGGRTEVHSELHIVVKFLGITVYREQADRDEQWRQDRLVSFHGITVTNGDTLAIKGEAQGDRFLITSPTGTVAAPSDIHPSNPWSLSMMRGDTIMSTKTGRIFRPHVSIDEVDRMTPQGRAVRLRHFEVVTDKREQVWFDARGVPVEFSTEKDGTPIYFVLTNSR